MKKRYMDFNRRRSSNIAPKDISRVSLQSNTTALPLLISSLYNNYKDKTLSINENKRFSLKKSKSVFKFGASSLFRQNKKQSEGSIRLTELKSGMARIKEDIKLTNASNNNLKKKLKLMKYIALIKRRNKKRDPEKKDYFSSYLGFVDKIRERKGRSVEKVVNLNSKIKCLKERILDAESLIAKNKKEILDLRFKKVFYEKLKAKTTDIEGKRARLEELIGGRDIALSRHRLTLENEAVQKARLDDKIALYLIDAPAGKMNPAIDRLLRVAKKLQKDLGTVC